MKSLKIETFREAYGIDQVRSTMTVGELIEFLNGFEDERPVYLSFDNGYTYGGITGDMFEEIGADDRDYGVIGINKETKEKIVIEENLTEAEAVRFCEQWGWVYCDENCIDYWLQVSEKED